MGRPTLCNRNLTDAIAAEVERGTTLELAGEMNGVSRQSVYEWMARGNAGEPDPFAYYSETIARARATARANALAEIRHAVTPGQNPQPDWKARAWYLERTDRRGFGLRVEVTQRVEATFRDVLERLRQELDPSTYARVLAVMSDAIAGSGDSADDDGGVADPH